MQIEDQSFIHDGDFFLNRFPSFSENQSLMCNVHLSVFTMESKYIRNRHIWILVVLTQHQTFSKISSEIGWKFRKNLGKTLEAKKLDFDLIAVSIEICAGKKSWQTTKTKSRKDF